jgi:hypothetical protein
MLVQQFSHLLAPQLVRPGPETAQLGTSEVLASHGFAGASETFASRCGEVIWSCPPSPTRLSDGPPPSDSVV